MSAIHLGNEGVRVSVHVQWYKYACVRVGVCVWAISYVPELAVHSVGNNKEDNNKLTGMGGGGRYSYVLRAVKSCQRCHLGLRVCLCARKESKEEDSATSLWELVYIQVLCPWLSGVTLSLCMSSDCSWVWKDPYSLSPQVVICHVMMSRLQWCQHHVTCGSKTSFYSHSHWHLERLTYRFIFFGW